MHAILLFLKKSDLSVLFFGSYSALAKS